MIRVNKVNYVLYCTGLITGIMIKFTCRDYGFDCDFVTNSDDASGAIVEYSKHSEEEHGIEYSKEVLMQFIMRKG